ncbi:JAB domain-containing protein [Weeksella virosa]|uniref:JAB domain-containing protein n=1 Tax=Weeksella virosa TaxID=1014 RepID=UPI00255553BE|nr:JAB domain-containing protein [Weeksella virosa]MDK7375983.1 JAB domain-containing protein [Weeksella virosa]
MNTLNESFTFEYCLTKKYKTNQQTKKITIKNAYDVNQFARTIYQGEEGIFESFFTIYLDNSNNVLGYSRIGKGGITSVNVDIRLIFNNAILSLATAIILVHNHPSGKLNPSNADIEITQKIKKAGEILDIKVLDHLIITEHSFKSIINEI